MRRFRTGLDRMLSRRWVRILFLIISGGLTGACMTFSSFPLMLAEWISLIPTCLVIFRLADDLAEKSTGRIRFRTFVRLWVYGFIFFMSEYLVVYHWFVSMYPLEFTGISKLGAAAVRCHQPGLIRVFCRKRVSPGMNLEPVISFSVRRNCTTTVNSYCINICICHLKLYRKSRS